jgi:ribonuclease HI
MLKVAKKYKTNLAALCLTPQLNAQLPAWYHIAATHRLMQGAATKCLIRKHKAVTVADFLKISSRIRNAPAEEHRPTPYCCCRDCNVDRLLNSLNPHDCATEATIRLQQINPKWNPLTNHPANDNLSLTPSRKVRNEWAKKNNKNITFDPSITSKMNLTECFRIFTDLQKISDLPATCHLTRPQVRGIQPITAYTDGACFNNGKGDAICGSGIWFGQNDHRNTALRVPGTSQSNQVGEICTIIMAAEKTPRYQPMIITTDSMYAINGLTAHLDDWEDKGWTEIKNAPFFKKAAYLLRKRSVVTSFQWIKGHARNLGNEQSDILAKQGALKENEDALDLEIPKEFDLQGARLAALTQATAYRGIKEHKPNATREQSTRNIQLTQEAILNYIGTNETEAAIWHGIQRSVIRPRVSQFLYKTMHGTQKIGSYWDRIPGYQDRQTCLKCGTMESMEHILVKCREKPTKPIWQLTREIWPEQTYKWPNISLGLILGSGSITAPKEDAHLNEQQVKHDRRVRHAKGPTRLMHIVITESAHLIWVLRCKRVIRGKVYTEGEIKSRWHQVINARLTDDRITATKIKREPKFRNLIKATWAPPLSKQGALPMNWLNNREVLVGRRTRGTP